MLAKVSIKNGQSLETDNCITTIIYIPSFTVAIFGYQAQLINTEILSDKIKSIYYSLVTPSKSSHLYIDFAICK